MEDGKRIGALPLEPVFVSEVTNLKGKGCQTLLNVVDEEVFKLILSGVETLLNLLLRHGALDSANLIGLETRCLLNGPASLPRGNHGHNLCL